MVTEITEGIRITVKPIFKPEFSNCEDNHYIFSYKVIIENETNFSIQLLKRCWSIFDTSGEYSVVEGKGVVGEIPVIAPGEMYEYESNCKLTTDMGRMHGYFMMERKTDGKLLKVNIPAFEMYVPERMN
jgi:ApaG protein